MKGMLKQLLLTSIVATSVWLPVDAATTPKSEVLGANDERMEWWREAKYGMFIHWGLYAEPARGE